AVVGPWREGKWGLRGETNATFLYFFFPNSYPRGRTRKERSRKLPRPMRKAKPGPSYCCRLTCGIYSYCPFVSTTVVTLLAVVVDIPVAPKRQQQQYGLGMFLEVGLWPGGGGRGINMLSHPTVGVQQNFLSSAHEELNIYLTRNMTT
ncbi:unnamed protein product, partial [Laminaria digitata]